MLIVSFIITILIQIGLPIALAVWITRRYKVSWKLIVIGMMTFFGSQILRLPLLQLLTNLFQNGTLPMPPFEWQMPFNAVLLGLTAGLFEETARWLGFRYAKEPGTTHKGALALGIGHGGAESVFLVGLPVMLNFISMLVMTQVGVEGMNLPADQIEAAKSALASFWALSWDYPLLGGVERILALTMQIGFAMLIWQAVVRRSWLWYAAAVLLHALVDFAVVMLAQSGVNYWLVEAALGVPALLGAGVIVYFWRRERNVVEPVVEVVQ